MYGEETDCTRELWHKLLDGFVGRKLVSIQDHEGGCLLIFSRDRVLHFSGMCAEAEGNLLCKVDEQEFVVFYHA